MEGIGSYNSTAGLDILEPATELRLGLPGTREETPQRRAPTRDNKRALDATYSNALVDGVGGREVVPVAKVQVVGWPPVGHHRKNSFQLGRKEEGVDGGLIYVKVSMDGAPYLRKIDLNVYKGYTNLREALKDLFKCFSLGELEDNNGSGYVIAYEDKDGDLMLVGDVPWGMFISSCKRLRIMKGSDTRGLDTNQ